mmetsp:Transcript_15311/g.33296  ORF Transcript_15311/g.33296 Transcript_15311/m.33296 type:complete len:208 (+) Transcript_15311:159-782(+)|eukprot:CAMPEP_0178515412 /NCGR_PEP_ID=MMETSP0696-20121128/24543_1 /TAXON_ID=265572 /ORGANISM="Extubocellulus spinifer, Strain CCMP396" /LENGTH=207 /DNA_ID=CAMNT_0020145573 /DNA_START=94 /DNA_END=717 /DNA_ORIENTATION=+
MNEENKQGVDGKELPLDAEPIAMSMDGPTVKWAVNDLLAFNSRLFMAYHVALSGWDYMVPFGTIIGGMLYGVGYRPLPALQLMGNTGLGFGVFGMCAGLGLMTKTAMAGKGHSGLAWDDDGIQTRVDGLRHNFMVRVMDNGAWNGIILAAGAMAVAGGPKAMGLGAGKMGVLQGLVLGSAIGSLGGIGCVSYTKRSESNDFDDDKED